METTVTKKSQIKRPSLYKFLTELPFALMTFIKGYLFFKKAPVENIQKETPILVIPGLLTSDYSTWLLRRFLKKKGYQTYGWGRGTNLANPMDVKKISVQIEDIVEKHNSPLILIGWSLGGIYARHLAKVQSEKVVQVITLGSPYMGVNEPNRAALTFKILRRGKAISRDEEVMVENLPKPLSIPSVAVFSKSDGIVPWEACCEPNASDPHVNFEVKPGHFGMGVSRELFEALPNLLVR